VSFISPSVFVVATWLAAICGAVSIASTLVSAIVGYQLAEKSTREANVEIAKSNARQKEAELQILQLRFPRSLDIDKFNKAVAMMPRPTSFEVLYDANAPDASFLASLIWGTFFNAKWTTQQTQGEAPLKAPPPNILPYANMPWTQAAGGAPWGISVVVSSQQEVNEGPLGKALAKAFLESVKGPPSQVTIGFQTSEPVPAGGVRIIVGPKTP